MKKVTANQAAKLLGIAVDKLGILEKQGLIHATLNKEGIASYFAEEISRIKSPRSPTLAEEAAQVGAQIQQEVFTGVSSLLRSRRAYTILGAVISSCFVLLFVILAILFYIYPSQMSDYFGYYYRFNSAEQKLSLSNEKEGNVLAASTGPVVASTKTSLLADIIKPVAAVSLIAVKAVDNQKYTQIATNPVEASALSALTGTSLSGTNGSALNIPVFSTDAQGRVTGVTDTAIAGLTISHFGSANISQWTNNSGYLTSEADTLASVTERGATSSTGLTLSSAANDITAGTLRVGGEAFTDLTGTGLALSSGALIVSGLTNTNLSGTAGITNANLANSAITTAGNSGSGSVSLGGGLTFTGAGITNIVTSGSTVTVTGTEADTLASVTGRGATSSTAISLSGGLTLSAGNFDQSGSSDTFKTGTGAVSLNGITTLAANKAFIITGAAGDPTATNGTVWYDTTANKFKIVEGGVVKTVCNTTDLGCSAGGASSSWWNMTNGALYPINATLDFLLGGTSTSSAKFALMNVNSGTPTASIAGNLGIAVPTGANPATTYNIFNGGTFSLQTSSGGDTGLTSRLFVKNNGNVGIGTTTPTQALDVNGNVVNSGYYSASTGNLNLRASGSTAGNTNNGSIYLQNASGTTVGRVDTATTVSTTGGTGRDGQATIASGSKNCTTATIAAHRTVADCIATSISTTSNSGQKTVTVSSSSGFDTGDEVLLMQMTGTGQGNYEFRKVVSTTSTSIVVETNLTNTYTNDGSSKPQAIRVPNYSEFSIASGATLTVSAWNGTTGGILAFRVKNLFSNAGTVDANGLGFSGGAGGGAGGSAGTGGAGSTTAASNGIDGSDGTAGTAGSGPGAGGAGGAGIKGVKGTGASATTNGGGAGGGAGAGGIGAGGAYGVTTTAGGTADGGAGGQGSVGVSAGTAGTGGAAGTAGTSYGSSDLSTLYLGSGGGGGGSGGGGGGGGGASATTNSAGATGGAGGTGSAGGTGGGVVFIEAGVFSSTGTVRANGSTGTAGTAGSNGSASSTSNNGLGLSSASGGGGGGGGAGAPGGGGSGGAVYIQTANLAAAGTITSSGGTTTAIGNGGNGGNSGAANAGAALGVARTGGGGGGGGGATGGTAGTAGTASSGVGGTATNGSNGTAGNTISPTSSAGGVGRVRCDTPAGSGCTTTPTANQNVYSASTGNSYATLYIGAINTTSADLAEYYPTFDLTIAAGDVVAIAEHNGSYGLVKASASSSAYPIGIVSTSPGLILGGGDTPKDDERMVGLAGRVPVKVSLENGPIAIGDSLTIASVAGVAKKATGSDPIIGIALQPVTAQDTKATIDALIRWGGQTKSVDVNKAISSGGLIKEDVTFAGNVTFEKRPTVNQDTAGFVTIKEGAKSVDVLFAQEYPGTPVVTANAVWDTDADTLQMAVSKAMFLLPKQDFIIAGITKKGFSILLEEPAAIDLKFSWTVLNIPEVHQ